MLIMTNKTNTTNQSLSGLPSIFGATGGVKPIFVSLFASKLSSTPSWLSSLPRWKNGKFLLCFVWGGKDFSRRCMYYIIYCMSPIFFWNLECLKKKCEDFFFRAMLLSSLISFPTDPSQLVRCFLVIPWHETMEIFKVSPVKMKTSVVVFFKRVKQWLIIYWTNVCFFFQGEKNELKV